MAINKQTIISAFDDKLTLLQWLKTINKALDEAVLTGVEVRQKGNATFTFVVTFEDGTELESNRFVLAQGESINGATIRNGHLYLSLTNGDELDAGNLKPVTSFEINASQHLIVNYGDGTSQDLGAIFSGNVNIDGSLNATKVTGNEIIENMSGYSFEKLTKTNVQIVTTYAGIVKNGNKVTFVCSGTLQRSGDLAGWNSPIGRFHFPQEIGLKLYPTMLGGTSALSFGSLALFKTYAESIEVPCLVIKDSNTAFTTNVYQLNNIALDTPYLFRFEITFLLSDNMAG